MSSIPSQKSHGIHCHLSGFIVYPSYALISNYYKLHYWDGGWKYVYWEILRRNRERRLIPSCIQTATIYRGHCERMWSPAMRDHVARPPRLRRSRWRAGFAPRNDMIATWYEPSASSFLMLFFKREVVWIRTVDRGKTGQAKMGERLNLIDAGLLLWSWAYCL